MDNSVSQSLCSNVYVLSLSCLLELTKRVSLKPEGPDLLVDSGRLETVGTAAAPSPGAEQWQDSQTVAPLARTGATDCPLRRAGAQSANLCQPQDNSTTLKTIWWCAAEQCIATASANSMAQASLAERPCAVLNTCTPRNWDICYGGQQMRGARATSTHGSQLDDYAVRAFVINGGTSY